MPFSLLKTQSFNEELKPWKVLIVDDEEDIHTITKMALKRFELEGRHLVFFSAHNSQEAKNILANIDECRWTDTTSKMLLVANQLKLRI